MGSTGYSPSIRFSPAITYLYKTRVSIWAILLTPVSGSDALCACHQREQEVHRHRLGGKACRIQQDPSDQLRLGRCRSPRTLGRRVSSTISEADVTHAIPISRRGASDAGSATGQYRGRVCHELGGALIPHVKSGALRIAGSLHEPAGSHPSGRPQRGGSGITGFDARLRLMMFLRPTCPQIREYIGRHLREIVTSSEMRYHLRLSMSIDPYPIDGAQAQALILKSASAGSAMLTAAEPIRALTVSSKVIYRWGD